MFFPGRTPCHRSSSPRRDHCPRGASRPPGSLGPPRGSGPPRSGVPQRYSSPCAHSARGSNSTPCPVNPRSPGRACCQTCTTLHSSPLILEWSYTIYIILPFQYDNNGDTDLISYIHTYRISDTMTMFPKLLYFTYCIFVPIW